MLKKELQYLIILIITISNSNCKKVYAPPETNANFLFLSVDGFINTGPTGVSTFHLTRSQNLSDTGSEIAERGARVSIQSSGGDSYELTDTGSNGVYVSQSLSLDPTKTFVLSVITSDGNKYASDPVTPKLTPPIDSVTWTLGLDGAANTTAVSIFVNSHDPTNDTRFYRWDFIETWEHESKFKTFYVVENKKIIYTSDSTKHFFYCYSNANSTNVLISSSANLASDLIVQAPIQKILQNDPRMDIKYSILVRQYALDSKAYDHWVLVQKISQSLGGLFDIQPAQLTGNMHNLTKPGQVVYGYVSASSVQEKRIFISNGDLPGWKSELELSCPTPSNYPQPGAAFNDYLNIDPNFTFFKYDDAFPTKQVSIPPACINCSYQGGWNVKPSFWP